MHIKHCFRACVGDIIATIDGHLNDKKLNINTTVILNSNGECPDDAIGYTPSRYPKINKMFKYLALTRKDVFADLGCGQGRVVFVAAQQKIKKAIGIEYDTELSRIFQDNLKSLRTKKTEIELITADATKANLNEITVFYLFHPFGSHTLLKVIDNIKSTLKTNPRNIRLVYSSAIYRNILNNNDWLEFEGEIDNTGIYVWKNKSI